MSQIQKEGHDEEEKGEDDEIKRNFAPFAARLVMSVITPRILMLFGHAQCSIEGCVIGLSKNATCFAYHHNSDVIGPQDL